MEQMRVALNLFLKSFELLIGEIAFYGGRSWTWWLVWFHWLFVQLRKWLLHFSSKSLLLCYNFENVLVLGVFYLACPFHSLGHLQGNTMVITGWMGDFIFC